MKSINQEILELWGKTPEEELNGLMPSFFPKLAQDSIMFIGINPSFSAKGFKSILCNTDYKSINVEEFYNYPASNIFDLEKAVEIETLAKEKHPYFNKFRILSENVGLGKTGWEHVDLFFLRETNQKKIAKHLLYKDEKLKPFGAEQIAISKKIIEISKPKVIVVANALGSRIFLNEFKPKFDKSKGCHIISINDKETPVFLTSTLTGQRALDNFTFKRLCWHIKKVILYKP